jgi:flagellar export protein FliJ
MKRFQFPLEQVRRWRAEQAHLEELKLRQARAHLVSLADAKRRIEADRVRGREEVLARQPVEARDLQSLDAYALHVRNKIRDLENQEVQCQSRVAEQRQRVIEARRQQELLERLKQKALEEWRAASDREQEALAAEIYLGNWVRRR